jgi:hypothetical protein
MVSRPQQNNAAGQFTSYNNRKPFASHMSTRRLASDVRRNAFILEVFVLRDDIQTVNSLICKSDPSQAELDAWQRIKTALAELGTTPCPLYHNGDDCHIFRILDMGFCCDKPCSISARRT